MRLFVAIDLPAGIREQLAVMSCGLPGARWVGSEHLHLTLRFIGEVDGILFQAIREALARVRGDPFAMQLDGVGYFPPRKKPRVVWVGIRENPDLGRLRNRIESSLVRIGLAPERRKFSPHITLARLNRTPASRVGRYLEDHALFRSPEFRVERFRLYSSVLGRNGATHTVEQEYLLSSRAGPGW
ncbi:MAG TPA: RNA 2',3'-cyclic phosphodiesterase [Desulfobulbus sp.]|nr:RNA 2',3'-cyclic phosphodiesterase [Desulfobulbus sp.]